MAAAVKFDDGYNYISSSGFPARQKFKSQQSETSSGAWLLAHHAEQRRHFKVVLCSKPRTFDEIRTQRKKAEKEGTTISLPAANSDKDVDEGHILDGFFLLRHCCVQDPADLCTVNISGQNLTETVVKDFELFENVAVVHAADNLLSLEPLSGFRALRELQLAVNGIRGITIEDGQFMHLQKLDMSFNNLSIGDVRELGNLPQLVDLDISGNNLYSLPADMSQPMADEYVTNSDDDDEQKSGQKSKTRMRFVRLQRLIADDNKLSVDSVFVALAGLTSLLHLSLQKNDIQRIPHLLAVDDQYMVQDEASDRRSSSGRRSARRSARLSARKQRGSASFEAQITGGDAEQPIVSQSSKVVGLVSAGSNQTESLACGAENGVFVHAEGQESPLAINFASSAPFAFDLSELSVGGETSTQQPVKDAQSTLEPPFANLKHLNLASNKINKEEAVLAVTAWPCLRELVLYDNPLTLNNRTTNLLIVNRFLQEKLGIQVQCRKSVSPTRHHVEMTLKSERKVSSKVPAIPRCNVEQLLLSIEAAPTRLAPRSQSACELASVSSRSPLPPIASACNWSVDGGGNSNDNTDESTFTRERMNMLESEKEQPPGTDKEGAPIFMTEMGEVADNVDDVDSDSEDSEMPPDTRVVDEQPTKQNDSVCEGYELLYDVDETALDDNLPQPRDIVGNVRALNYALNHPLVFRDSLVHLDQKQKPYQSLPRKPDPAYTTGPTRTEKVNAVLNNLKTRQTYVEAPLPEAIADRKQNKDFANAKKLLAEVQQRYSIARVTSVAAARQPSSMLRHPGNRLKVTSQTTK